MSRGQTNRPKDNPLYQQRLKAWKPLLTFKDASIFFFVTGIIVLILGIVIFISDQNVFESSIDYTDCNDRSSNIPCSHNTNLYKIKCTCNSYIEIPRNIQAPVYFYYGMNNFYQNHRLLIRSFDINQLMGKSPPSAEKCDPVIKDNLSRYYAPCGQFPNVIFNDTFTLIRNSDNLTVPWTSEDIALSSDKKRYGTPLTWNNTVQPPNWQTPINVQHKNAYADDEELQVWMRSAPLPRFRKLHRILKSPGSLLSGNYTLYINYNYPVKQFSGQKFFIVTNLSWIGGKNITFGILYLVTGIIEILIGIITLALYLKFPEKKKKENTIIMSTNF